MKNIRLFISLFLVVIFLSGCSSSGVIPLDKGVYYISKSGTTLGVVGPPPPETIASVYKEANEFCKTKGKEVKRINNIYTNSAYGQLANFALEFECVSYTN